MIKAPSINATEIARWTVGPLYILLAVSIFMGLHHLGYSKPVVYYTASICVILMTQILEILLPFEKAWVKPDDQFWNELGSTFISSTLGHNIGRVLAYGLFGSVIVWWSPSGGPWWPSSLPFALQVAIAFVFWEFGLYWNHRFMHGRAWRFHALHHKARRLSWANSGYGHPVSYLMTSFCDLGVLLILGAPADVLLFTSFLSGSINFLSHANVDMKMGWLSYIFVTPEVHRWHHANDRDSGARNFGTQLMVWDVIFGTFYLPKDKPAPRDLGHDEHQPSRFLDQWLAPFMPQRIERKPGIPRERGAFQFAPSRRARQAGSESASRSAAMPKS